MGLVGDVQPHRFILNISMVTDGYILTSTFVDLQEAKKPTIAADTSSDLATLSSKTRFRGTNKATSNTPIPPPQQQNNAENVTLGVIGIDLGQRCAIGACYVEGLSTERRKQVVNLSKKADADMVGWVRLAQSDPEQKENCVAGMELRLRTISSNHGRLGEYQKWLANVRSEATPS